MKKRTVIFGIPWLLLVLGAAANPATQPVVGRTIYHADNSRTESVRDPNTRELTETTYTSNNVLSVRKVFLLNEKGEPLQGNVYDGRGNLIARCQSIYDEFGRRREDRLMNLNGVVFQQVIHEYGKDGKPLKPKVINLDANAPSIKPAAIDFTGAAPAPAAPGQLPNSGRFAPAGAAEGGVMPPVYAPGTAPATPAPEKAKGNFFKRLFQKKEP